MFTLALEFYLVDGRGRGGGRGGRSRTGSRHSASNHRFSAVGINRNPVRLIAILPFGSPEILSYPAREGYFPCPESGGEIHLPTESEYGSTENRNSHSDNSESSGQNINSNLLSTNQFVYICFNETKPQDEPIDVFDTTVAVVVILLIFGLLFDLTRRASSNGPAPTLTNIFPRQQSESLPEIDQDHVLRIQRMARASRRATAPCTATSTDEFPPLAISPSPTPSLSRKSSEDKPPSYREVVPPPPTYEECMRAARVKMNQNAQRLLKK